MPVHAEDTVKDQNELSELKHFKQSESVLCSGYHWRNKMLISEGNGINRTEAADRQACLRKLTEY